MSAWQYLRKIYTLETLDTRLVTSSRSPPNASGEVQKDSKEKQDIASRAQPSRWGTPEYYFYYFIFLTIVPLMFYTTFSVSRPSHPEFAHFEHLLSPGWVPGRRVDNSDQQYASFRDNIPYMAMVVVLHPILRRFYESIYHRFHSIAAGQHQQGEYRLRMRVSFDITFAAVFLLALHGFSAFKVFAILCANYLIAKRMPRSAVPAVTWSFNMFVLFANELCHGYPYAKIAEVILPAPFAGGEISWASWLDSVGGLIPRWEILFNFTVLRLISFNMDYYWSIDHQRSTAVEKKQLDPALLSERDRVSIPASPTDFNFIYYLAYVLYSPLYLAGPVINFNDYMAQTRFRPTSIGASRTLAYGIRFLLSLLSMELILHYIYAVAISKSQPDWSRYSPFQLSMLAFFNLHIIWLKLLLPWRFFRLWSLLDGVDPPENMVRCMSNNYSPLAFWRGWHRSLNRWIVRYLFVPLGGSGRGTSQIRSIVNMLIVFMFVALWHDINARLLAWSWLIVLFVLPEIVCTALAKASIKKPNTYRLLSGMGAVVNILMMMVANLVGFALGLDGLQSIVSSIVSGWQGWAFLWTAGAVLFVGVMVMFEWREDEKRRGIDLKY